MATKSLRKKWERKQGKQEVSTKKRDNNSH